MNNAGFIGTGWALPIQLADGRLETLSGPALIEQAIWLILRTRPGELVVRPDFGSGLSDLVFEPNDATLIGRIISAVEDALGQWEPRIDVIDVRVLPVADAPRQLAVEIDYRVRETNSRFNFVYPFYLGDAA